MPDDWRQGGFGLYLHWPFCQAKCPYCDFNSHVAAQIDQKRWERAYLREITRMGQETPGRVLNSVFFGGGTPSMMAPELVDAILTKIRATWPMANDIEVTLEANPTSVEAGRFAGYKDAGVNRVSLGIQALHDDDLRALGRLHTVAEARAAFDIARACFARVSFDLIYARQGQGLKAWGAELSSAMAMAVDHLSLYQLTIEPGTAFGDRHAAGRLRDLPDDDTAADMYDLTQDICGTHGFPAYEVSNHAKSGAESTHNKIYWRTGDYIGIGPGAHGRLTLDGKRYATETPLAPATWLLQTEQAGHGESARAVLDSADQLTEFLLMGLRLAEGVSTARLKDLDGAHLDNNINTLVDEGWLLRSPEALLVSPKGRPVLNAVLRRVLAD